MDMWEPFINRVQHHCPAAKIVFDLFHLVSAFGHVIDEVRRSEYRKANQSQREVIKGRRYLLLSNVVNLKADQKASLKELLAVNTTIAATHALRDQFKEIYMYRRQAWAKKALDAWCDMASQIDHPDVKRFVGRLRFFEYGILNHCDFPIGTSKLEGVNNKIKVIKRRAYGYHDPEYFALKVKQAFPGQSLPNFSGGEPEFIYGDTPAKTRAYVICGKGVTGRVEIPLDSLDRWAVNRQQAEKLRLELKAQEKSPKATKKQRLAKPLLGASKDRDRMLDALGKNAKHRKVYEIVFDQWDEPHEEILRTVQTETGLNLVHPSRISHMKKRMAQWFTGSRPQSPQKKDETAVEKAVGRLYTIYVKKGSLGHPLESTG